MRIALLGDKRALIGFGLAGVEDASFPVNDEDLRKEFKRMTKDPDIGIVLIDRASTLRLTKEIDRFKSKRVLYPVIVTVPDGTAAEGPDLIDRIIRRAVGIGLNDVQR